MRTMNSNHARLTDLAADPEQTPNVRMGHFNVRPPTLPGASRRRATPPRRAWDALNVCRRVQLPTDCTLLKSTDSAPICNCMPLDRLWTPVAVPITLYGTAVTLPLESAPATATL
jgi:hypothetical protein